LYNGKCNSGTKNRWKSQEYLENSQEFVDYVYLKNLEMPRLNYCGQVNIEGFSLYLVEYQKKLELNM